MCKSADLEWDQMDRTISCLANDWPSRRQGDRKNPSIRSSALKRRVDPLEPASAS
ncbi:hypothetical protein Mapa_007694 [Marchantia paleacea]|nr:hypothetical protein Mapa_007694 [Marchantia paleacea]